MDVAQEGIGGGLRRVFQRAVEFGLPLECARYGFARDGGPVGVEPVRHGMRYRHRRQQGGGKAQGAQGMCGMTGWHGLRFGLLGKR